MECQEVERCKQCEVTLSHGYTTADDPPMWMWRFCSEWCTRRYARHLFIRLLEEVHSFLDGDGMTKKEMRESIDFCKEELRYTVT